MITADNFEVVRKVSSSRRPLGGVYQIVDCVTGESYVGTTHLLRERRHGHFVALASGRGWTPALQAAYDAHGPNAFAFYVLEILQWEDRLDYDYQRPYRREWEWMRRLRPSLNRAVPFRPNPGAVARQKKRDAARAAKVAAIR